MKRFLTVTLLLLSIMFTSAIYAQADSVIADGIQLNEVERIVDKYTSKVAVGITGLAESMEVPAKHVYKVLVKQAVVDSIVWFLILLTGILLMLPFWGTFKRDIDWDDLDETIRTVVKDKEGNETVQEDTKKSGAEIISKLIMAIIGLITIVIGIFHIGTMVQGFVNPEYKAIQDIVQMTSDLMK